MRERGETELSTLNYPALDHSTEGWAPSNDTARRADVNRLTSATPYLSRKFAAGSAISNGNQIDAGRPGGIGERQPDRLYGASPRQSRPDRIEVYDRAAVLSPETDCERRRFQLVDREAE